MWWRGRGSPELLATVKVGLIQAVLVRPLKTSTVGSSEATAVRTSPSATQAHASPAQPTDAAEKDDVFHRLQFWPTEALQACLEEHSLACPDGPVDRAVLCELVGSLIERGDVKHGETTTTMRVTGTERPRPPAPRDAWRAPPRDSKAWTMVDDSAGEVLRCIAEHSVTLLVAPTGGLK